MIESLDLSVPSCESISSTYLVAPTSAEYLDAYLDSNSDTGLLLSPVWVYRNHLNLDDLDFADDGIWPTLKRVVGRRGLGVWAVSRFCR